MLTPRRFFLGCGAKKGISGIFLVNLYGWVLELNMIITKPILLRVFSGSDAASVQQLQMSIQIFVGQNPGAAEFLKVEYHSNRSIRTEENVDTFRNPDYLINWLMEADIYIIASQGIWLGLVTSLAALKDGWSVARIAQALKRLSESPKIGFPRGMQLFDPVWSGDKIEYIRLLQDDGVCIPTMKIDLDRVYDDDAVGPLGFEIFQ